MRDATKNVFSNRLSIAIKATIGLTAMGMLSNTHAETLMLEEVIVTAQKRSESLQDVPVAVYRLQRRHHPGSRYQ